MTKKIVRKAFALGDKVAWETHGGSPSKTVRKEGTIIMVLEPRTRTPADLSDRGVVRFSLGSRDHCSYIVGCQPLPGSKKTHLYWPIVSKLNLVEAPQAESAA